MSKKLLLLLLLIVFINPSFAQIEKLEDQTTAFTKETELTIKKPDGVKTGDIMIVTIAQKESDDNNPLSVGWILVAGADIEEKGKHAWGAVLYKIVADADASVTNYTFTLSAPKEAIGVIVAFSGVDVDTPFDAIGEITLTEGKDSDPSTTAITTVSRDAAVLMLGMAKDNIGWDSWKTDTDPGDLEKLFSFTADKINASVGAAWAIKEAVGTTGLGTVVTSGKNADKSGVILIALKPSCSASFPNIWDGNKWLYKTAADDKILFSKSYPSDSGLNVDIEGCSCKVEEGANVTIKEGLTLKIKNEVDVDPKGTLTFENNASLVQINDAAVNFGKITYKRHTTKVKRYDYTYWSSPVEGQTLKALSPNTLSDKYYGYDNGWVLYYNGAKTMNIGEGYIIRAPQSFSITNATIDTAPQFIGVPNNGPKEVVIGRSGDYLLGNPYPSAINADAFLIANTGTTGALQGTLYFWTHNSPPSSAVAGDATYNYTGNDYASYNVTGGVGTAAIKDLDPNDPNDNNNFSLPTGEMAAGQAFFAPSSVNGGKVMFDNSMRQINDAPIDNSRFFKMSDSKGKSTNAIKKNRVWLNLTNEQGAFKQTLVGYITGATNGNEGVFDGESYDGNQFVDFYSVNNGKNLTIQGRALPFDEMDTVPLGYSSFIAGSFAIGIDQVDGLMVDKDVFIEDKLLDTIHDLKKESYSFTTEKGAFNDRFILRYTNANKTLAKEDFELPEKGVLISNKNKEVKVNSSSEVIDKVVIYDMSGRQIYKNTNVNNKDLVIRNMQLAKQVLFVKVVLQDGRSITKKVIY
jgi:hypothetical protein